MTPLWRRPGSGRTVSPPDDVLGVVDAVGTALDGRQLSRGELAAEVARLRRDPRLGEMLLSGWGGLLKPGKRGRLTVRAVPFGPLTPSAVAGVEAEAARLAKHFDAAVSSEMAV